MRRPRLSLRSKLTLIFAGVMGLVLAVIGSFLFYNTKANLDDAIHASLRTRAGTLAQSIQRSPGSPADLVAHGERFAQVLTRNDSVLDSRPQNAAPLLSRAEAQAVARPKIFERGEDDRLLAIPVRANNRDLVAVVGASLADREHALESLGGALLIGGPVALLLASALAYWIAGAALRPVELMQRRASEITKADSRARLPVSETHDEIHRLATTLNDMLNRLAQAADHERTFVANASHELRTPLATIRAELELALRHATSLEQFRDAARAAIRDSDGLSRLADDLLILARADSGRLPLRPEDIYVPRMLRAVADELARDARLGERVVRVEDVGAIAVRADPDRVTQALRNMTGNALLHGSGAITLGAEQHHDVVRLRVTDEGPLLDEPTIAAAFERFSRGSTSFELPGAGLGLPIVREIARGHGGDARLVNIDAGVSCILELPAATGRARISEPVESRS